MSSNSFVSISGAMVRRMSALTQAGHADDRLFLGGRSLDQELNVEVDSHERTVAGGHIFVTQQCRAGAKCWARSFFDLSGDDLLVSENEARLD